MKRSLMIFLLFGWLTGFSQETDFKEYSFSELFQMIENEKDSVFELEDVFIVFNEETDSNFVNNTRNTIGEWVGPRAKQLVINKEIIFNNVHLRNGVIHNVIFKKKVEINQTLSIHFRECVFEKKLMSLSDKDLQKALEVWDLREKFELVKCKLLKSARVFYQCMDLEDAGVQIRLFENEIWLDQDISDRSGFEDGFYVFGRNISAIWMDNNEFIGTSKVHYRAIDNTFHSITENNFNDGLSMIHITGSKGFNRVSIEDNQFNRNVFLEIDKFDPKYSIPWDQFKSTLIDLNSWQSNSNWSEYISQNLVEDEIEAEFSIKRNPPDSVLQYYMNEFIVEDTKTFKGNLALRGRFHNFYKAKYDNEDANQVYIELKELETKRLSFLYKQHPTFRNYFKWKVNQFLKLFSDYGTEPSKAIVFSMYVILFFALIYLFFPNSWDSHGRNRIVDRYTFFMKYMRQNAGVHEVYLDDKKEEMLSYEKFRSFIESSEHHVPKFFTGTALPLYKWAISGTRLTSSFLKRVDVMQGSWTDVPKKNRWWKRILLIGAFSLAIVYDLGIKMLNALMLSINTFTTLGFGEIPIKGLPRYLAIIQGFIGWFMLTIFSVSLISQLLN